MDYGVIIEGFVVGGLYGFFYFVFVGFGGRVFAVVEEGCDLVRG